MASDFTTVVAAGKGWTRVRTADGQEYTLRGARNWRNNNPGNIEYGPFAQSMGAIGSDGRFAVFPSYDAGRNAKSSLLFNSPRYNTKTIEGAISKYAPPTENNTRNYISRVASALGLAPETPLQALSPEQQGTMMDAMQRVEGFRVGRAFDAEGNIVDPSALQVNQTGGIMQAINAPVPQQRPGTGLLASTPVERRELPAPSGLLSAYQPVAEPTAAQVSLDTLRQPQPQPSMSIADQYASYGAGKAAPQQAGLLSQDVAHQRMIDQLNAQKQQLQAGINPMDDAEPWKTQPGIVSQPAQEVAQVQAPEMSYQPISQPAQEFTGGLLSPQEQQQFAAQRAFLSQQPTNKQKSGLGKGVAGALGGGLLGGLMLGPLGGLIGAALGKSAMNGRINTMVTGYPTAPSRAGSTGNTGKINKSQLNESGRNAYNTSEQFRDAVDRGDVGLY